MIIIFKRAALAATVAFGLGAPALAQMPPPSPPPAAQPDKPGPRLTEAQIRKSLEMQGFTEIETPRLSGDTYVVRAKREGRAVDLRVDAVSGDVEVQG